MARLYTQGARLDRRATPWSTDYLLTTDYSLLTTHYLLPTTYYLLHTKVRAFANTHPEEYFNESIRHDPKLTPADLGVLRKQARWHGEMY